MSCDPFIPCPSCYTFPSRNISEISIAYVRFAWNLHDCAMDIKSGDTRVNSLWSPGRITFLVIKIVMYIASQLSICMYFVCLVNLVN